jgi:single-stranded-DNA-specific exonuclease
LAPFGLKNQEPVFLVRNFQIKDVVVLGEKHLKLMGNGASAIGFFLAEDSAIMNHIDSVKRCDMLGTISYNCFRGNGTPQLSIQEIVLGDEIIRDEHDDIELEEEVK